MLFLTYLLLGASIFYHIESRLEIEKIALAKRERIEINGKEIITSDDGDNDDDNSNDYLSLVSHGRWSINWCNNPGLNIDEITLTYTQIIDMNRFTKYSTLYWVSSHLHTLWSV